MYVFIYFIILIILNVQFRGIMYVRRVVQPSPPSTSRTFSSCQTEAPYPLNDNSLFLLMPSLLQPPFYFLSVSVCLFCITHVSDWLISLSIISSSFIHVVACVRISFLFKAELYFFVCLYHILFVHSSVGEHLGCFHLLTFVSNAAISMAYTNTCLSSCFQFFWLYT